MEINKPNDIFVLNIGVPDLNVLDLRKSNMNSENTELLPKDTYKNSEFVKKTFTNAEGKFNDKAFNDTYLKASKVFSELTDDEFLENSIEWDASNIMRPTNAKIAENYAVISKDSNPWKSLYGRTSLTSVSPGNLSLRELQQQGRIYDTKAEKFLDKSANDLGLFGAYSHDTLVYAQYEEDGEHKDLDSGRMVKHKKGEAKLDNLGAFYTETLAGRDIAGRKVVNPTDLITKDGSTFNSIDFWDSDGLEKSVVGTTMKLATEIAPFFIPGSLIPKAGMIYGGMKAALGLSKVLPTFYKAIEGIALGDDTKGNETNLWKAATKIEGNMAKYGAASYSDEANSLFTFEQMSGMVSSIFSQIYEQRAVASLSTLFTKVNDPKYLQKLSNIATAELESAAITGNITKNSVDAIATAAYQSIPGVAAKFGKQSNLAKSLSLGYMSLTSTAGVYQEALAGGYDRRTAGIAAVLSASALYRVMNNNELGTWFLDETVGYRTNVEIATIKKAIKESSALDDIAAGVKLMDSNKELGKKGISSAFSKFKQTFDKYSDLTPTKSAIVNSSIVESIEEVSEEVVQDAVKGVVDTFTWLSSDTNQGSFKTASNIFSKQGLERYLGSMFGGAIGGGLFELSRLKIEPLVEHGAIAKDTQTSLIRLVANGKGDEIKKVLDNQLKSIGNTSLSPNITTINGENIYLVDDKVSQAETIVNGSKKYIDYLESILAVENLLETDESLIKKTILQEIKIQDLEKTGVHKFILSDFNEIAQSVVINKTKVDANNADTKAVEELKLARDEAVKILTGQYANKYKELAIFAANKDLHSPFFSLDVLAYAREKYRVDFESLPKEGGTLSQKSISDEFKEILQAPDNNKAKIKTAFEIFKKYTENYSTKLAEYAEDKNLNARQKYNSLLNNVDFIKYGTVASMQTALNTSSLPGYNLGETFNMPLGDLLYEEGYLNDSYILPNGTTINNVADNIEFLNGITIPTNNLNIHFLHNSISSLVDSEINSLVEQSTNDITIDNSNAILQLQQKKNIFKNSNDKTILPLEVSFLLKNLEDVDIISEEIKDVVLKRISPIFNKAKQDNKIDIEDIIDQYTDTPYDDIPEEFTSDITSIINNYNKNIENSTSLKSLNKVISTLNILKTEINNIYTKYNNDNTFSSKINSILDKIVLIDNKLLLNAEIILNKSVSENKLYAIIDNLSKDIFGDNGINAINYLQDEISFFEKLDSANEYIRTSGTISDLKNIQSVLNLLGAVNVAMVDTPIDISTPYGFNVNMRVGAKKSENPEIADSYAIISQEAYQSFKEELQNLQNKIKYLLELAELNSVSIINKQDNIKNKVISLLYNTLTDTKSNISALKMTIGGVPLLESTEVGDILLSNFTEEEKLYKLENLIYTKFYSLAGDNIEGALDEVFKEFSNEEIVKSILNSKGTGFTESMEFIENEDYYKYLHTILAVNSNNFYNLYKKQLEKELNLPNKEGEESNKKIPFFGQRFIVQSGYSYIKNPRVMSHAMGFLKRIVDNSKNNGEVIYTDKVIVTDIFVILGSPGVGKTTVLSNFLARMIENDKEELHLTAPSEKVLSKLKKDVSKELINIPTVKEKENLFRWLLQDDLYQNYKDSEASLISKVTNGKIIENLLIPEENSVINVRNFNQRDILLTTSFINNLKNVATNIPKRIVIFADEVSWFSPLDLQILDVFAKEGKIAFIGYGDDFQDGYSLPNFPYSLESVYFNGPAKLKGTIRGENIHKSDNTIQFELALNNMLLQFKNEGLVNPPLNISYSTVDNLNGDKFSESLNIEDLKTLDASKEIAVITDSGNLTLEEETILNNSGLTYTVLARNSVKGQEYDQVVILYEIPFNNDPVVLYNVTKHLNTLISRAKTASIIFNNTKLKEALNINNIHKKTTSNITFNSNQIDIALQKEIDTLNKIQFTEVEASQPVIKLNVEAELYDDSKEISEVIDITSDIPIDIPSKDGDNKYMIYSFYNILNAKLNEVDDIEVLDIEPIKIIGELHNMQMLLPKKGIVGYSLGGENLWEDVQNNPRKYIQYFIEFKNYILHTNIKGFNNDPNILTTNNPFKKLLDSSGEFVIKPIIYNGEYNAPFGKQAHRLDPITNKPMLPKIGDTFLHLMYKVVIDNESHYVSLAALPDTNNKLLNEKFPENAQKLKDIHTSLVSGEQSEVVITPNIDIYSSIKFIYEDGKSKLNPNIKNNIEISGETFEDLVRQLQFKSPGIKVKNVSNIEVFGADITAIEKTLKEVNYKIDGAENLNIKNPAGFRLRPYITVSYVDADNNNFSRIIVLSPKIRSLKQATNEYTAMAEIIRNDGTSKDVRQKIISDLPILISKWNGNQAFIDIIKILKKESDSEELIEAFEQLIIIADTMIRKTSYTKLDKASRWITIFNILEQAESMKTLTIDEKNIVLGMLPDDTFHSNIGLRMMDILNEIFNDEVSVFNKISPNGLDAIANLNIFYNDKYKSSHNTDNDKMFVMDKEYIKYFKITSYLEPPIFMLNLSNKANKTKQISNSISINTNTNINTEIQNKISVYTDENLVFVQRILDDAWNTFISNPDITRLPESTLKNDFLELQKYLLQTALLDPTFYFDKKIDLTSLASRNLLISKTNKLHITADNVIEVSDELVEYINDNSVTNTFIKSIKNNNEIC